jgi:hypothetical protein
VQRRGVVVGLGRVAGHGVADAAHPAQRRGQHLAAQGEQGGAGSRVAPVARERYVDDQGAAAGHRGGRDGHAERAARAVRRRSRLQRANRVAHPGAGEVAAGHHDLGRRRRLRERRGDPVHGLQHR